MDDGRHHAPTRKNIMDAFARMTQYSKAGDTVYIHYSGHGGRQAGTFCRRQGRRLSLMCGLILTGKNSTSVFFFSSHADRDGDEVSRRCGRKNRGKAASYYCSGGEV